MHLPQHGQVSAMKEILLLFEYVFKELVDFFFFF